MKKTLARGLLVTFVTALVFVMPPMIYAHFGEAGATTLLVTILSVSAGCGYIVVSRTKSTYDLDTWEW